MIERLAGLITDKQIEKGNIEEKDRAVYQYGYILMAEVFINVMISVIIGILFHTLIEVIVLLLVFIPLRSYAGGYHMAHAWQCIIMTNILVLLITVCSGYLADCVPAGMWIVPDILAGSVIWYLSPVDTAAKPLDEEEKIIFRKKARFICTAEICLNIFMLLCGWKRLVCVAVMSHCALVLSLVLEKKLNGSSYRG